MSQQTIKATYLKRDGTPVQEAFSLYKYKGEFLTAVPDSDSMAVNAYVSHTHYDSIVAAFNKLPPRFQDDYKRQALNYVTGTQETEPHSQGYADALAKVGLSCSKTNFQIIADHVQGGSLRHEAVYSVGGYPVPAGFMTPPNISFSMKTMDTRTAKELCSALKEARSFDDIVKAFKNSGFDVTRAQECAQQPNIRLLAPKAFTPA